MPLASMMTPEPSPDRAGRSEAARSRGGEAPACGSPKKFSKGESGRWMVAGRAPGLRAKFRGRMVVLILTTVGMIRLETARNALESDFAEAMSPASSARLAAEP